MINEETEAVTFIDKSNLKMFVAKGWKMYSPESKKESTTKRKRNNKK